MPIKLPLKIRSRLINSGILSDLIIKNYIKKGIIIHKTEIEKHLAQAKPLISEIKNCKVNVGIVKDGIEYGDYVHKNASWLRYERFLKTNNINYKFYDIYRSDWIKEASDLDVILWHTPSTPSDQDIAESKIYILEKVLGKTCFPSFHELWQYEDKCRANYLYECLDIPTIPTIVTNNKTEALEIIAQADFPFITKAKIGAGSSGVRIINSKKSAKKMIRKIFNNGYITAWPYYRHKDYFYYQKYINDASYDLRIIIIGNKVFGYYRYPKKGDFRASGSGIVEKKAIPEEAIRLAMSVKNKLNSRQMGIDLLYSEKDNKYYIIETSIFNQIDTPKQLVIDGIPGYYEVKDKEIIFNEGCLWVQELVLELIINEWQQNKNDRE